jgi:CRP-like cAMP-binding protein
MTLQPGQFIGEECILANLPVLYSAKATHDGTRLMRIPAAQFKALLCPEDLAFVENKMWRKLKYQLDRLKALNLTQSLIFGAHKALENLPE